MKIKYSHYFLLVLFLCFSSNLLVAQGIVEGIVTGDDQPEGLISAQVAANGVGTVTEFDGSYSLSLPAGTHTITYSYTGYEDYTETVTLADGETKKIDVEMKLATHILNTATVTSGKFDKPLGEVTVSLEVIKPALAEATNSTTVDQVLDRVPGVTIVDGQANIRGGSGFSYGAGSRVLLLVDDIPILSGDAGFPTWSDVPVENISQVEVVKGAASALYGSSALNGIINIRTAYAKSEPETNVSLFSDIYTSPKDEAKKWWEPDSITRPYRFGGSIVHRRKIKKLDLVLGTTAYKTITYTQNARDNKIRFNTKLRYRFTEKFNAGIYANYNWGRSNTVFLWENNAEGAYSGDPNNQTNTKVNRYNIDPFVNYTDKFNNKHRYIGRYFVTKNDNTNDQGNFSDNFYNEYQFQRKFKKPGIVLTTGGVLMNSIITGSLYGDFKFKSANRALYVQTEKKFYLSKNEDGSKNEKKNVLNLTFGARYEYNKLLGPDTVYYVPNNFDLFDVIENGEFKESRPVFRVGASYQAAEFTFLRTSWGQGYRSPTIAEKYISTQVSALNILPNPLLESETGWSAEIGLKQGFKIGSVEGFVDLSGFWSRYQDMMEFNFIFIPNPFTLGFQSTNIGNTDIKGMEISIAGRAASESKVPITFLLGYTFIEPRFREFEAYDLPYDVTTDISELTPGQLNNFYSSANTNILKYRNRHSFKSDVEATIAEKYIVGLSLNGASKMVAIDEAFSALAGVGEYREQNNNGFAIFDVRAGYNITDQIKVSMIAKNLFNTEYAARPALLQPMRSFSFRVDCKF